jgi:hypothetical protein
MEAISWIIENYDTIIEGVFAFVGFASVVAKLTPTQSDDKAIDAILRALNAVACNPKKDKARDK